LKDGGAFIRTNHAYAVTWFNHGKVHLYNPHGRNDSTKTLFDPIEDKMSGDFTLPLSDFCKAFTRLYEVQLP
jgi:hypothetical protein